MTRSLTAWVSVHVDDLERLTAMRPDAPFSSPDWFRIDASPDEAVFIAVVPPERGGLLVLDAAPPDPTKKPSPKPAPVVVRGGPKLIELRAAAGGRRVQIMGDNDVVRGATYRLAVATTAENGLAGLLDLVRSLADDNQPAARKQLLEQAARSLDRSPQAAQLAQLLAAP